MNILQESCILKSLNKNSKSYNFTVIAFLLVLLLAEIFLSISIGSVKISFPDIVASIKQADQASETYRIINYVRIPRTIAAVFAGCALSVAGAILQSVLNNSLASPSIIGVNSGAGLFFVLIAAFFPASIYLSTIAAFAGAIVAVFLVYFIAKKTGASRMVIVLAGVAVSSFIGAITDTILTLKPDTVMARAGFIIGGFSGITMDRVAFAGIIILIAFFIALILSYDMNVLALGDESAKSLGLNVIGVRFSSLIIAAVLAGSAISFAGLIGFVGLIVPHASRFLVGHDNRIIIPVSALIGSIFTLLCDLLARVLFAPYEIPVGIIMSFLGGPFFIYLLMKRRRGQLYD